MKEGRGRRGGERLDPHLGLALPQGGGEVKKNRDTITEGTQCSVDEKKNTKLTRKKKGANQRRSQWPA